MDLTPILLVIADLNQLGQFYQSNCTCDEAGARVCDGLAAALAESLPSDLDGVHLELPVALPRHRNVRERSHVVVGVRTSQQNLQVQIY